MSSPVTEPIPRFYDLHPDPGDLVAEILCGLRQTPKRIAPKFFYDRRGSELFEEITRQPEYYLTRTERWLFEQHGEEMALGLGRDAVVVELGSGNASKIRLLLEHLRPSAYLSADISREFLLESGRALEAAFPWLEVHLACLDYTRPWDLPAALAGHDLVAFYPGSTIGNFEPEAAARFLDNLRSVLGGGMRLLIGVDLRKDRAVLEAAYNDVQGVTAAFNRNILEVVNRVADGDFDPSRFRHVASYSEHEGRVEMHLEATAPHRATVAGHSIEIQRGERIHTENSYKYTVNGFHALASEAGYRPERVWSDPSNLFSVHLLRAVRDEPGEP